ncbi:MAG: SDR family NAD(P)-dependent oxidoreductase [Candidatus Lokiarchaeota archaeon]|nr:SDR family NAD(P)-dependent oxidoreductase [Candidatus Lokiarchaeota archaeon]
MSSLENKTLFITGASRGIGKYIGLKAAKDGANIVIVAKTTEPHPDLPGTIYTAAEEMEEAGGKALPIATDIRFEEQVQSAIDEAVDQFGGIDILVNNASAINLSQTPNIPMKRFDLLFSVNARGTFVCSKLCYPYLKKAEDPHILMMSPPLTMKARWFENHLAYTMSKYGMSMCVLGMAEEFKPVGIAVNALWPKTAIATAAVRNILGGDRSIQHSRKPEIVADAAYSIFNRPSRECTGNFFIDEQVLCEQGITELEQYAVTPGASLLEDFFLEDHHKSSCFNQENKKLNKKS